MVRLVALGVCLVFALHSGVCSAEAFDSNVKVAIVHNLTTFLRVNPDVKLLQPLIKEQRNDASSPRIQIKYQLGNRISGKNKFETNFELNVRKWNWNVFILNIRRSVVCHSQWWQSMGLSTRYQAHFDISKIWNWQCCHIHSSSCWSGMHFDRSFFSLLSFKTEIIIYFDSLAPCEE